MSVIRNMVRTYRSPRIVTRGMIAQGVTEPQVLAFGLLSCGLIFVAQWPGLSRAATLDPSITFEQRMGGALFGIMFMLPLLLYGVAGLMQLAVRVLARPVQGLHVRLVLFWSLLSVTPLMLVQGGLAAFLGPTEGVTAFGFVVTAVFLYIVGAGLLEVARPRHGDAP
ncbi:YIP1 family protein [Roseinatronobacter monicus]|uniref:YIP1 family protein n=1 Tax=Roseinatronobacter monicus TaxID=393481 RepID=UPI003F3DCA39